MNSSLRKGEYSDSEVSDVTNALLDGANGFVLKDCNDLENYIDTIKSLNELCCTVEPYTNSKTNFWRVIDEVLFLINRIIFIKTKFTVDRRGYSFFKGNHVYNELIMFNNTF